MELLALLGYFAQIMKNVNMREEISGVFEQGGEMQQMLSISKRFSDQLDDMHQVFFSSNFSVFFYEVMFFADKLKLT